MKKVTALLITAIYAIASFATVTPAQAATFTWSSQPLVNLKPEGAVINGGFTNFPTKSGLYIQQCAAPAVAGDRPANCFDLLWVSASGMQGTTSPKGNISFTLKAQFNGKQGPVDCSKSECGLFFRLDHLATADRSEDTYMKISFAEATSAPSLLAVDAISLTLNGKPLMKNVPVNLAYQTPAKIVATSTSGLPVTITSATPECSFQNGTITALKGAGVCALNTATAGDSKFEAARANFPFLLTPGVQKIALKSVVIAKGKTKSLPAESNFGEAVTYKSNSKRCRVELNLVEVKGNCVITATAPAKQDMWGALKSTITIKVK